MVELSEFQKALAQGDYGEAQRIRDLRTPIPTGTFEGWLSPDKIGMWGQKIQPVLIYPKMTPEQLQRSGQFDTMGEKNFIWTGNWKLDDSQFQELDKNLNRALSESGLEVLPTQTKNSGQDLTSWRISEGPEPELGVSNWDYGEGVVPMYIVRGLGNYAGATPGTAEFGNPFAQVGDSVIEALAGYSGPTAFSRYLQEIDGLPPDQANYMASRQAQMGTVLHEAMHMTGALPHTGDEGGYQDYTTNYGGQHGENFMHAITNDIRGKRSDDVGEAMRLVMGEPWNYGWGTDANPDMATADPITNKDEFKANVQASPHPHPHPQPHTSPGETIPISRSKPDPRRTVTLDPLQQEPIVPAIQDIVESTPESIGDTETMADNVPFKKIKGVWHVMNGDTGEWETSDAWQAVLQDVTKVTRDSNGYPQFHYGISGTSAGIEGVDAPATEGIYTADQIRSRYQSMVGTQEAAQDIDLEETWFNTFNIEIPDIFQRGQLDEVLYDSYTTNNQGERVPATGARPLIDADKLQEVLNMLEGRGALRLQEPVVVTVPGVEDAFVSVGGQVFKSKKSPTGQPGATNVQDIPGTDYKMITSPTGAVSTVKKSDPSYAPGVLPETGPGSIDLPGYDILQDREGGLTPYTQRYDPSFTVDPKTMMPYFQQPDGRLEVADMPSMDDLVTQYLVAGQTGKAVAMANFRDRPTSMEYFNAAMEWARSPADIFTVSAIVRGIFQPEPGPMGELRRIGAPPSWARDAWVALQSSMGIPAQGITSEPGAEEGSFVAGGGDPSVVPTIQSEFGIPNVSATDQTVTTGNAERLYTETGFTISEQKEAAAQDADLTGEDPAVPMDIDSIIEQFQTETVPFRPQLEEYDEFAASMSDTGFRFGDVQGISSEDLFNADGTGMLDILERENPEAFALAEQIFQGQGGIENAGAFFDSVQGLENAINHHLTGIRGMGAIDLDDSGAEESVQKPPIDPPIDPPEVPLELVGNNNTIITTDSRQGFDQPTGEGDLLSQFTSAVSGTPGRQGFDQPTGEGDIIPGVDVGNIYDPMFDEGAPSSPGSLWWQEALKPEYTPMTEEEMFSFGPGSYGGAMQDFDISSPYAGERREFDYEQARRDRIEESARNIPEITPTSVGQANILDIPPLPYSERVFEQDPVLTHGEDYGAYSIGPDRFTTGFDVPYERIPQDFGAIEGYEEWGAYPPSMLGSPERFAGDPDYEAPGFYDMVDVQGGVAGDIPITYGTYQEPPPPPPTAAELSAELDVYGGSLPPPPTFPGPPLLPGDRYQEPDEEEEFIPEVEAFDPGDFFYQEPDPGDYYEVPDPSPEPVYEVDIPTQPEPIYDDWAMDVEPETVWEPVYYDDYYFDEFANGGTSFGGMALVGEEGPELVDLPPGAQVMPAGITEMMAGRPTRRPRSLFRQAGMRAPSAQTISNLLPEEIEVYQEMGRLAGIPEKAFEREFRSMVPMGQGGTNQARFTPRGTGRTRYGRR